ncbi:hypothetical protein BWQ96_06298 [Gracilariopsis chorda]|uniref:Uncharacterized protein n=1 Tax=Gracilariopsis chorda TaxID=448386 RepID=A0A2V3IPF4_9FLOR|nr:hypothetical protein BWQ96_06298 [Gracilariopsis chorda]|eukprot:PXF43929.1 hypothetical protein BWQ96_06298 [Gracilariopsis chorda]
MVTSAPSIGPSKMRDDCFHGVSSLPSQRNAPREAQIDDQASPSIPVHDQGVRPWAINKEYANAEMPPEPTTEHSYISKKLATLDAQGRAPLMESNYVGHEKTVTLASPAKE